MTLAQDRFPPIPENLWTEEQRRFAQPMIDGPRGAVIGPFIPLMRSPELMDCAQRMGAYLRFRSAIGTRLSEFVILITARHWTQQVEWAIHAPLAEKEGISKEIIAAIASFETPQGMSAEELAVYDFSMDMHRNKKVSDDNFERAKALFGEQGVMDLLGLLGYYSFLGVVLNGSQTRIAAAGVPPLSTP